MHFWIDKRSQQCGFGRSRVAASLSHTGNGLSYGHPPRRSKPSNSNIGGSNSSSGGNNLASVHRSPAPYGSDCHVGASTSRQATQYNSSSSNNNANVSNNPQQQQHYSSLNNNSNAASTTAITTASNNNNANATASSAAVLTDSGTIVPLVARGNNYHQARTRYQPRAQHQQQIQHYPQQHYSYNYHHPQFGNMAVPVRQHETHQQQQQHHHQQQQQHSGVYADDAYSAYHHHQSNNSSCNNSRYATPRRHNSGSNIRHAAAATAAAPPTLATSASTAAVSATPIPITTSQPRRQSQQLQQYHQALLQHADSQLLPSHLKCGMCASLVLASVFVAGTKFYFDHQGTGLEVLIFCAFSATFFLAACMVSLCRIPKGLIRSRSDGRAACQSRGVSAGAGSNANGCMLELNDVRYLDERQVEISAATAAAAAAGPPPYHIAILLPEQTQTILGKQLPLDESPPPSYDKILV